MQILLKLKDFLSDFLGERKNSSYKAKYEQLDELIIEAYSYNGWFTDEFVKKALHGIVQLLEPTKLAEFVKEIKIGVSIIQCFIYMFIFISDVKCSLIF